MKLAMFLAIALAVSAIAAFVSVPLAVSLAAASIFIVAVAIPMRITHRPSFPALAFGVIAGALALSGSAHAATIDLGVIAANGLADFVSAIVVGLVSLALGWVLYVVKNKFNIDIEATNRDALNAFVQRQARSLVADGATKLSGVKIEVSNTALASAANTAIAAVPDALKYFGLTPEKVSEMIVDALPQVPSVAQAQAVALDVANPATPSKAP